jgi:hypothetical protein
MNAPCRRPRTVAHRSKLAVDLSGLHVLIQAMESFPNSIEVQQQGALTLLSLARFPQLREHRKVGTTVVCTFMEKFDLMCNMAAVRT